MNLQHFGPSPLPAYEPAFDWENERSMIFGQRISEAPLSQYAPHLFFFLLPAIGVRKFYLGLRLGCCCFCWKGRSVKVLLRSRICISALEVFYPWLTLCFSFFVSFLDGLSGLKISVKVQSLSFQAGLLGEFFALGTRVLW